MSSRLWIYRNLSVDSPIVHILSASCAGFAASTATNPIWFVKTRLQLDHSSKVKMTVTQCVKKIYQTSGIIGFYKGMYDREISLRYSIIISFRTVYQLTVLYTTYRSPGITASYVGISETVIHFVIYEAIKAKIVSKKISS